MPRYVGPHVTFPDQSYQTRAAYTGYPAYAPANLLGRMDNLLSVYNLKGSNSRRWHASLGKAQLSGSANHLFIGDSETDSFNGTTYDQLHMNPQIYRNISGVPVAGTGHVKAGGFSATGDPRWTFTGGWAGGASGASYSYASSAGTATFITTDPPGTNVEIVYGSNASTAFTYSVQNQNGVQIASGTVTPSTSSAAKLSLTGLTGAYKVVLTYGGAGTVVVFTADIFNVTGLRVHNLAYYGAKTSDWTDVSVYYTFQRVALAAVPVPDVVFCALGVNDVANAVATATTIANLSSIRSAFASSDFVLIAQYQPGAVTQANWEALLAPMYTLADTLDVPLVDLYDRSGGYTLANANGLMGDATHPNGGAQADWAALLAKCVHAADLTDMDARDYAPVPPWKQSGTLTVKTGTDRWYNDLPRTLRVRSVRATVGTAPTGAAVIVDVKKNGTTMYTTSANRPTIAVSTTTVAAVLPDVLTLLPGDYLTVDIAQIGSTVAGADLTVQLSFVQQ